MDPLSAYAIAISAVANLISKMIDGQSPEQKMILWQWFIEDMQVLRNLFKLNQSSNESPLNQENLK